MYTLKIFLSNVMFFIRLLQLIQLQNHQGGNMKRIVYVLLALSLFTVLGCSGDTNNITNTGNASIYGPKGKVQGVLRDAVTNLPLANAVIDLGFGTATTNSNGQFTLVNVPAVADALDPTATATYSGDYTATINLAGTNALIKAANPNDPNVYLYPEVEYRQISVRFTSQNQPTDSTFFFGTYSTASVVREELTTTHDFQIGKKSTTVNGVAYYAAGVSGKGLQPLPVGSTVKLFTNVASTNSGAGVTRRLLDTTTTGVNGTFTFSKVQSNTAVQFDALTADGKYFGTRAGIATPNTDGGFLYIDQIGGTVAAKVGIALTAIDTQVPIIIAATPETGSDIDPATPATIVFTFSEPIAASAYADALTASTTTGLYNDIAVNYNGAKAGNVAHSLVWNGARTALTVTIPVIGASSKYSVDLTTVIGKLKDSDGNVLSDPNGLKTVSFTTFGGAAAAAPSVTITNSANLDYNSSAVLDWNPTSGAKYYAVYRSMVQNWGTTTNVHPYQLLGTTYDSIYTDASAADIAVGANYPAAQNKKFVENGSIKLTYTYLVKAFNSDNVDGAASAAVTAVDVNGPQLLASQAAVILLDLMNADNTVRLYFNEPLDEATAEVAANYTLSNITGAPSVQSAVYNGWDDTNGWSTVDLTFSANIDPTTVSQALIDTGVNGINNTVVNAADAQVIANGNGLANSTCVSYGLNALLDSAVNAADTNVPASLLVNSGANGICQTTAAGDDVQNLPVGNGQPSQTAVRSGNDLILNSVAAGDDVVTTFVVLKVTGVTDVAGNAIRTAADELASGYSAPNGTAAQRTIR